MRLSSWKGGPEISSLIEVGPISWDSTNGERVTKLSSELAKGVMLSEVRS